jgi:predicted DCC family thiol-disulfide oxidoreductase YuxK
MSTMSSSLISKKTLFDNSFISINGVEEPTVASDKDRLLVFYDGGCPLCSREIAFYDKLNRTSMGKIAFVNLEKIRPLPTATVMSSTDDSSPLQQLTTAYDIDVPAAYRRLHALREDGSVHISAHAFCEIWQRLPYWHVLERIVRRSPGVLPLAGIIYEFFAARRIQWRMGLSSDVACSMGNK